MTSSANPDRRGPQTRCGGGTPDARQGAPGPQRPACSELPEGHRRAVVHSAGAQTTPRWPPGQALRFRRNGGRASGNGAPYKGSAVTHFRQFPQTNARLTEGGTHLRKARGGLRGPGLVSHLPPPSVGTSTPPRPHLRAETQRWFHPLRCARSGRRGLRSARSLRTWAGRAPMGLQPHRVGHSRGRVA